MLVTFTNRAAREIAEKCGAEAQRLITHGTFHSIAYRILRQNGYNYHICDESKQRLIIKRVFNCKKDKDRLKEIYEHISLAKSAYPMESDDTVQKYNAELAKYKLLDFDDIIFTFIETSPKLNFQRSNYILVDELQDTSGPQLEQLRRIYGLGGNNNSGTTDRTVCERTDSQKNEGALNPVIIGVADDDQCQPIGNQVLTTDGYIDISLLDPKIHRVPAYDGHGKLYGLNNPHGYKINKSSRTYNGLVYTISTEENSFTCTYNHKCYVQWIKEKANKIYVTYLMKRDERFRIGQCKLIQRDGCLHLGVRSRIEKADSVWILSTHNTRKEAIIKETTLSIQFRIPTITFEQTNSSIHFDQETIDSIFNQLDESDLYGEALDLLDYFNRDINYPLWTKADYTKQGARTFFITQACNIIPNIMCVGEYNGSRKLVKKEIKDIKCEWASALKVYSLNVEKFHNYVCNQILVSNSIYQWRGARPENVRDFIDYFGCRVLNMGYNFRSRRVIVQKSAKLIENNTKRIEKTIRPFRSEKGSIKVMEYDHPMEEIDAVVRLCELFDENEVGILYRNRTYKHHLEYQLRKNGIKYKVNDLFDITDRSPIKVVISTMKIASSEFDLYDLQNASKGISGLGSTTVEKIGEDYKDSDIKECLDSKKYTKRLTSLRTLRDYFNSTEGRLDLLVSEIVLALKPSYEMPEDMLSFLRDITHEYKMNRADIREIANEMGLNGQEEQNDEGALIELSTVHGYKGMEREIIILPFAQQYLEVRPGRKVDIEDERRLFYVAVTRAKDLLYICHTGDKPRFIGEMDL